jgi:hypothetical protein
MATFVCVFAQMVTAYRAPKHGLVIFFDHVLVQHQNKTVGITSAMIKRLPTVAVLEAKNTTIPAVLNNAADKPETKYIIDILHLSLKASTPIAEPYSKPINNFKLIESVHSMLNPQRAPTTRQTTKTNFCFNACTILEYNACHKRRHEMPFGPYIFVGLS